MLMNFNMCYSAKILSKIGLSNWTDLCFAEPFQVRAVPPSPIDIDQTMDFANSAFTGA